MWNTAGSSIRTYGPTSAIEMPFRIGSIRLASPLRMARLRRLPRPANVVRHLWRGTFPPAVRRYLAGPRPDADTVRWSGTADVARAAAVLVEHGRRFSEAAPGAPAVLTVGGSDELHQAVDRGLRREQIDVRSFDTDDFTQRADLSVADVAGILCCTAQSSDATRIAQTVASRPQLASLPFEYVGGLDSERAQFEALDEYPATWFVSPVLLDEPTPYSIYEESLTQFEQKCGLRDFLDLYQLLKHIVDNEVPGDVAEFGSYKGHSGYLIARTLDALASDKRLYLFDAFDSFPHESLGVDYFWSDTHEVDFNAVRSAFAEMPRVELIKGDFTATFAASSVGTLAMAYIDCDSYRATRYLLGALPGRIATNGLLVCEDYGHPALLGNRAAVHESLGQGPGWFRFFSQFSGFYVVLKL